VGLGRNPGRRNIHIPSLLFWDSSSLSLLLSGSELLSPAHLSGEGSKALCTYSLVHHHLKTVLSAIALQPFSKISGPHQCPLLCWTRAVTPASIIRAHPLITQGWQQVLETGRIRPLISPVFFFFFKNVYCIYFQINFRISLLEKSARVWTELLLNIQNNLGRSSILIMLKNVILYNKIF
jgi:hypothetical protein